MSGSTFPGNIYYYYYFIWRRVEGAKKRSSIYCCAAQWIKLDLKIILRLLVLIVHLVYWWFLVFKWNTIKVGFVDIYLAFLAIVVSSYHTIQEYLAREIRLDRLLGSTLVSVLLLTSVTFNFPLYLFILPLTAVKTLESDIIKVLTHSLLYYRIHDLVEENDVKTSCIDGGHFVVKNNNLYTVQHVLYSLNIDSTLFSTVRGRNKIAPFTIVKVGDKVCGHFKFLVLYQAGNFYLTIPADIKGFFSYYLSHGISGGPVYDTTQNKTIALYSRQEYFLGQCLLLVHLLLIYGYISTPVFFLLRIILHLNPISLQSDLVTVEDGQHSSIGLC